MNTSKQIILHKYRALWALSVALLMVVFVLIVTVYCVKHIASSKGDKGGFHYARDYSLNPFAIYDAISVCEDEANLRLGSKLRDTTVNDLSTRFDGRKGIYFVVLDGRFGSATHYIFNQIYCHVDARHYMVNYFKTHDKNYRDFMISFVQQ